MEITVRFPNLGFLFEYEDRTFSVLGFDITIYGILMAVSLLIGLGMILLCARWQKLNLNLCLGASISALVGGVIGGRLYYIAFSWSQFSGKSWKILCDIRSGGMSIYGAILGGVLVAALFCRLSRTSFWKMADIVCMGLLSGQIIGVWGNFFNREAFGEYTDSLFAMGLPMDSVQKSAVTKLMKQHLVTFRDMDYIQVHPLFFYESIWCLLLLLILLLYTWRKKFEGEIFLRYLAGYGLGKCVIEWLRTDKLYIPKTKIPVSLLVSAALFLICGIVATVRRILSKRRSADAGERSVMPQKRKMMAADWKTFITLRMYRMSSETFLKNWIERERWWLKKIRNQMSRKIQNPQKLLKRQKRKFQSLSKMRKRQKLRRLQKLLNQRIRERRDLPNQLRLSQRLDRMIAKMYK